MDHKATPTKLEDSKAIDYVLNLQRERKRLKLIDQNNVRLQLNKPLLLDNPSQSLNTIQIRTKNDERKQLDRKKLLYKRSLRRPKLKCLSSETIEHDLFDIWKRHYGQEKVNSVNELSLNLDLHGCLIQIISSKTRKLPKNNIIEGVVIRETKDVLHLSNKARNKVFTVKKRGCVFSCQGVEFERVV
jgi:RNase P/RNase MRP subunit p29